MIIVMTIKVRVGIMLGIVILVNSCHLEAPSTLADSYSVGSTCCKAPRNITMTKPQKCHRSTNATE